MLQWRASLRTAQTADAAAQHVEGWPYPQAEEAFAAAKRYNRKIAASEQTVLERPKTRSKYGGRLACLRQIRWPPKIMSISRCWIPATA